ncbi:uncharacterized protein K441DRAFT_97134 [Cenococcum geophilum 1.58]|uniref:uncharacterized protein n=1 Tax=Cenococcum geophilum 1.58 TaxID=794803 RepID=UPI00358FDBE4|nr:hypothetical protein K441DRAFT_97134 [Cenococcum geophilum 1.58]
MTTLSGSSDALYAYTPILKPSSSTVVTSETSPAKSPLMESSLMEGLQDVPIHQYIGIPNLRRHVRAQSTELQAGRSNQQYLVFQGVTEYHLGKIDHERASIGKHTRMSHDTDDDLLVIKLMPSARHENAHITLGMELVLALIGMGLPRRCLYALGGTTFHGHNSSKEADSAYKPISRTQETDWPTIVFESGLSESLTRLRHDAQWWLTNSGGDVNIVVVISITPAVKRLRFEKWCLRPAPGNMPTTRAHPNRNPLVPTRVQEVTVTQNPAAQPSTAAQPSATIQPGPPPSYAVAGAPLTLEFQDILLRAPVPPEGNVTFTRADLEQFAEDFWECVN